MTPLGEQDNHEDAENLPVEFIVFKHQVTGIPENLRRAKAKLDWPAINLSWTISEDRDW